MQQLTQAKLKEVLEYNPDTGVFIRKAFSGNTAAGKAKIGHHAGGLDERGYIRIRVWGKKYRAHRLAWLWVYGTFPNGIDHINGDKTDNRIANLRIANQSENMQNRRGTTGSSSRYLGVSLYKPTGKWLAQIKHKSDVLYLGYYDSEEEAHAAYCEAKQKVHKFNPIVREHCK